MQFSFNRHLRFFRFPSFHSLLCFRDEWSDGSSNYNKYLFSFFLKLFTRFCLLLCLLCSALELRKLSVRFLFLLHRKKGNLFTEKIAEFCSREFSSSLYHFSLFAMIQTLRYLLSKRGRDWREGGERGGQSLGTIYENVIDGPAVKSAGVGRRLPLKVGGLQWKRLFKALIRGEWHVNETGCEKKGEGKSIKCRIYEFSFSFASSESCITSLPPSPPPSNEAAFQTDSTQSHSFSKRRKLNKHHQSPILFKCWPHLLHSLSFDSECPWCAIKNQLTKETSEPNKQKAQKSFFYNRKWP